MPVMFKPSVWPAVRPYRARAGHSFGSSRLGIEIRRRPNKRASTDHAPGPRTVRLPAIAAASKCAAATSPDRIAFQSSSDARAPAAIGVHNPASISAPTTAPTANSQTWCSSDGLLTRKPSSRKRQTANLSNRRPHPGHPSAKVEYRRCRSLASEDNGFTRAEVRLERASEETLLSETIASGFRDSRRSSRRAFDRWPAISQGYSSPGSLLLLRSAKAGRRFLCSPALGR